MTMTSPSFLQRSLLLLLILATLTSCGGGSAVRNSYPDGKGVRSLPPRPDPEYHDWMLKQFSTSGGEGQAVNYSEAVLALDIVRPGDDEKQLDELLTTLYPDMRAALSAARHSGTELLPSIDLLDVYQKYTDDRVLAALELELSTGELVYPGGKQQWLTDVLAAIPVDGDISRQRARAFLATSIRLAGGSASTDRELSALATRMKQQFEADKVASTVTGFYSQSESLSGIFLRDRFLQGIAGTQRPAWFAAEDPLEQLAVLREIDSVLSGSIALRDAYNDFLAIQETVTNPAGVGDLGDLASPPAGGVAIFPHSRSLEEQLFTASMTDDPMQLLKDALLAGQAELQPQADSGWYDYQQYAVETLLLPERAEEFAKLEIQPAYLARLEQAFEATVTQRRETQSKNLAVGEVASAPMLQDVPILHLEPAPTVYLRTARAYRFLHARLAEMHMPGSNQQLDWILDELHEASSRYLRLHILSCNDIGQRLGLTLADLDAAGYLQLHAPEALPDWPDNFSSAVTRDPRFQDGYAGFEADTLNELLAEAQDWLEQVEGPDPQQAAFVAYDPRVCVPAAQDNGTCLNWGVIGVRLLLLETAFSTVPQVVSGDTQYQEVLDRQLGSPRRMLLPVYEYAAFNTAAPVSREQFRDWCDQSRSKEEFMLVARAYGGSVGRSWLEQYGMWVILLICLALFRDRLLPGVFGPKKEAAAGEGS